MDLTVFLLGHTAMHPQGYALGYPQRAIHTLTRLRFHEHHHAGFTAEQASDKVLALFPRVPLVPWKRIIWQNDPRCDPMRHGNDWTSKEGIGGHG